MTSVQAKMADVAGLVYRDGDEQVKIPVSRPYPLGIVPGEPTSASLTAATEVVMPYHVTDSAEGCDGWAVVKDDDGEIMGCHATQAEANDQMSALYANEADGSSEVPAALEGEQWRALMVPEGVESGDSPKRVFAEGGLDHRDLPLPLRFVETDSGFHDGAVVVGSMTRQLRVGTNVWAFGTWDTDEDALEARRMVRNGMQRWVSVDADNIEDANVELVFPEGGEDDMLAMPEKVIFHKARTAALTIVQIPAFQEAVIEDLETESVEASGSDALVAASFPVHPPDEWFDDPGLSGPTPFTVTEGGRVFGHLATWGTCHTSVQGACTQPPEEDEFEYFRLGEVITASGASVAVGTLTMGTGHAGAHLKQLAAAEHYDNTGTAVADVAAGCDQFGIWVAGAARPDLTDIQLRRLRASKLSGDWRRFASRMRLVAALCVNVPGFPVPRPKVGMASGTQISLVASGVVTAEPHVKTHDFGLLAERVAATIGRDSQAQAAALADRLGR